MKKEIKKIIESAIRKIQKEKIWPNFAMPEIVVENPKEEKFGDYSSNVAMVLSKSLKKNPMEVAGEIVRFLPSPSPQPHPLPRRQAGTPLLGKGEGEEQAGEVDSGVIFKKIEVVKPGYINFHLSEKYFQDLIGKINSEENDFGKSDLGKGKKINNEFISANPTGPLTVGNGRGGFYGDVLSNVLRKSGFDVVNEYYVNDGGGQILKLGHSVLKDSEACYAGDYIDELNKKYGKLPIEEAGEKSAEYILENIIKKIVSEKMRIKYDLWTSERKDVVEKGYVEKAVELLKTKKLTYEKEGALWFRTTELGDDKDRVLIKSDGKLAYFASDCGYFLQKIERKFDKMFLILGADHHGYVGRMKAAAKALGFEGEFEFLITQLVRVVKDGKEVRMSKRAGNVVYIDELIDEVGHDVARFFFLMYSPDTHMSFDLGVAKERSEKNPVFYVQYAHARIASIETKAESLKQKEKPNLSLLKHEKEIELIKELNKFPELIEELGETYEVHKLPQYAIKLADKFHSFYNECRVIDEENPELTVARLELVKAVKIVLGETLRLIGVGAPEKM